MTVPLICGFLDGELWWSSITAESENGFNADCKLVPKSIIIDHLLSNISRSIKYERTNVILNSNNNISEIDDIISKPSSTTTKKDQINTGNSLNGISPGILLSIFGVRLSSALRRSHVTQTRTPWRSSIKIPYESTKQWRKINSKKRYKCKMLNSWPKSEEPHVKRFPQNIYVIAYIISKGFKNHKVRSNFYRWNRRADYTAFIHQKTGQKWWRGSNT